MGVPVLGDTVDEPNETFTLRLSSPSNATLADADGVGTITDDDLPPPPPDLVAPQTTISKAPPASTRSKSASFSFRSSETGSRFQCKLDRGAWKSCKSPATYRNVKKGRHTFLVRAIDAAGNVDATPAKKTWRRR